MGQCNCRRGQRYQNVNCELPKPREGMSAKEKQECQKMANQVADDKKKLIEKFKPQLTAKEKLALRRQAAAAASQALAHSKRLEAAESDRKRVDDTVKDLNPAISAATSLAGLDAPAEAIDRAKKEARGVAAQRDALAKEMKAEKTALADAENQHAAVVQREETQLKEAEQEVQAFRQRAKEVAKSLRSFFTRTFGEGTKFLKASLQAKVAANAGAVDEEKQVEESLQAVDELLATLRAESEESRSIRETLEQLRASLSRTEARVSDLSAWEGRVLASLDALEAELNAKKAQFDQ